MRALDPPFSVKQPLTSQCAKMSLRFSAFLNIPFNNPLLNSDHLFWRGFSAKPPEEWQFHSSLFWAFWVHSEQKLRECHDTAEQSKYLHKPWRPGSTEFKADLLCAAASSQLLCICGRHKQVGLATHLSRRIGELWQRSRADNFGGSRGRTEF